MGKPLLIDGKNHLMGRLASVVAKSVLNGQHVTVVRCEDMNISGKFIRNKLKFLSFLRKRCNVQPARGPFHYRSPSKIFNRTVRGMLPHKTKRGMSAIKRLQVYEGMPPKFARQKRFVVPKAMRVIRLRVGMKYTLLGRLSSEVGWKYQDVIKTLEIKRKLASKNRFRGSRRRGNCTSCR